MATSRINKRMAFEAVTMQAAMVSVISGGDNFQKLIDGLNDGD